MKSKITILVPGHNKVSIKDITTDLFDIAFLQMAANSVGGFDIEYTLSRPGSDYDGVILFRENLVVEEPAVLAEIKFI